MWAKRRREPYTVAGISRLRCVRCAGPAAYQWQVCSDGSNFRPLCAPCDVALNRMVLEWMGHPDAETLANLYAAEKLQEAR
jgi:hypothetical protein